MQRDFLATENMKLKNLNDAFAQKISSNKETIQILEKQIISLHEKDTMIGRWKIKQALCNIENLKVGSGWLKK